MSACRPAGESRKSTNANSDRLRPSSTNRALASLGVHPWRLAIRLRRFPLSAGRRMLMTTERVVLMGPLLYNVIIVSIVALLKWRSGANLCESGTHDLRQTNSLAGCGSAQNRGGEEAVGDGSASTVPVHRGNTQLKTTSSPEADAPGPSTVARRF